MGVDEQQPVALTVDEQKVVDLLTETWNAYLYLPDTFYGAKGDFHAALRAAQNIVLARPMQRAEQRRPDRGWRTAKPVTIEVDNKADCLIDVMPRESE